MIYIYIHTHLTIVSERAESQLINNKLLANNTSVCATRPNFQSMEQENNKKGASMMLMDSGKGSNFLLKGFIPPSGPSHFHNLH